MSGLECLGCMTLGPVVPGLSQPRFDVVGIFDVRGIRAANGSESHWRSLAMACSLLMIGVAACGRADGSKTPTIIVYGDSLTVQSESAALGIYQKTKQIVVFRAEGGSAICDWISQAKADNKALNPARIVIAFTGNTASCAASTYLTQGDKGVTGLYERSLRQMRSIFRTQRITLVIPPAMEPLPNSGFAFNGSPDLVAMYERVGPELHMTINTDADDNLTPGHIYQRYRPAYPDGKPVAVRLSDGIHLTPAGALWYGAALLDPHPHQPSPTPAPAPTRSPTSKRASPIGTPTPTSAQSGPSPWA